MPTTRLFDDNPYATIGTGVVLSCEQAEHQNAPCFAITLDRTIFFPEEGGQSPDQGTINNQAVLDVQVKNKIIYHYLEQPLEPGSTAMLKIDWQHRFSNMQQHSGEHIFSGLVHTLYNYDNVGFHVSDNSCTMDFNGVLTDEELKNVERRVNEAIVKNLPIEARYVDDATLATITYRSKKELEGPVRIVTIPGYDTCACCAPHVKTTGEIGMFKIIHCINYKGGVRINYLCGFRALEYFRESIEIIDSLTQFLTTGRENLFDYVEKLKAENASLSGKLLNAKQELLNNELQAIPADRENVILIKEKTDAVIMKNAVNFLTARHKGLVAFFAGDDANGYNYILSSETADVMAVQQILSQKLSAKGGGRPPMIRGSVQATCEQIKEALECAK